MSKKDPNFVAPFVRVGILLVSVIIIAVISYLNTGTIIPITAQDSLVFQNALLLLVFGSTLIEYHFTKPADSLINSLISIITLISVFNVSPSLNWWLIFAYCFLTFVLALINISVSAGKMLEGKQKIIADLTYLPAVYLGQARLIFSILFLFGVFSFYSSASPRFLSLLLFWAFYIVIWPLRLPEFISGLIIFNRNPTPIGKVIRSEWPNIARFEIKPSTQWKYDSPKYLKQADGRTNLVVPLYSQLQGEQLVGTGLIVMSLEVPGLKLLGNSLYDFSDLGRHVDIISQDALLESLGGGAGSKMIGFVVEGSTIGEINFECWEEDACREGMLVWCKVGKKRVYYQVVQGSNREESFQTHRQGYQLASAIQLGAYEKPSEFERYPWLPVMNTPVFAQLEDQPMPDQLPPVEGDFIFGKLPGSTFEIAGPFITNLESHTAILGITGSGKTELAFDLIRHTLDAGIKVICIDLTNKYAGRLADLKPAALGISDKLSEDLKQKLFEVETGTYGAPKEKAELKKFLDARNGEIQESLKHFLFENKDTNLGIISLPEIASTIAILHITEIYLSSLFRFARTDPKFPRILLVVEEAQTVMPEPTSMDWQSKDLMNRISQIALQGRKYKIGLLVISQRTATVSKSVLTQCNTIISFACIDDTSLGFLRNVYGEEYVKVIPNLQPLRAVVAGKSSRSRRPIIIEIPFDKKKAEAESPKKAPEV